MSTGDPPLQYGSGVSWPWPTQVTITHNVNVKISGQHGPITRLLEALGQKVDTMAEDFKAAMARIAAEVKENSDGIDSATTLLENLSQLVRDNKNDPAALTQLADALDLQSRKLAQSVLANTPAAEVPPDGPPDEPPVDPESPPQPSFGRKR